MKVSIIGAGAQGYVLTWSLARRSDVDSIIVADRDLTRAQDVAARWGTGKATAHEVDAGDSDAVAQLVAGSAILVNAVLPELDIPLMKAALKSRCHYIDMATRQPEGTIDEGYLAQMELDDSFRGADLTALITTGNTPGITNTLAAIGYEDLDRCERIRIRGTSNFSSEVPIQVWSQETWYIDCQSETLYFADGEYRLAAPFAGREGYEFPHPFGRRPVVHHAHEEHSTLPRWLPKLGEKGLAFVDFKMGTSDAALDSLKAVIDSGMASPIARSVKGTMVRPIDVFVSNLPPSAPPERIAELARAGKIVDEGVYVIDLHSGADEPPAESIFIHPPNIRQVTDWCPGANRISYGTSVPTAIYAGYLLDGKITQRGVLPPEGLERKIRLDYIQDLKDQGFRFARRSMRWL